MISISEICYKVYGIQGRIYFQHRVNQASLCTKIADSRNYDTTFTACLKYHRAMKPASWCMGCMPRVNQALFF
jgi:hypothetical protein